MIDHLPRLQVHITMEEAGLELLYGFPYLFLYSEGLQLSPPLACLLLCLELGPQLGYLLL